MSIIQEFVNRTRATEKDLHELYAGNHAEAFETLQDALRKGMEFFIKGPIGDLNTKDLLYLAAMVNKYRILSPEAFLNKLAEESQRIEANSSHT